VPDARVLAHDVRAADPEWPMALVLAADSAFARCEPAKADRVALRCATMCTNPCQSMLRPDAETAKALLDRAVAKKARGTAQEQLYVEAFVAMAGGGLRRAHELFRQAGSQLLCTKALNDFVHR
jgi:hypothetical protein